MRHALPGNCGILLALLVTTSTDILAQHVRVSAPPRSSQDTTVGTIVFPNSGAAAAQSSFLRGVALLHTFSYDRARAAFQQAERIDPDFALAYWGEALSDRWPQGGLEDTLAVRA